MAKAMQFDVGMDNGEFMRGSKDIARAISSLKSTVAAAGKSMNSSASGYGQAMRQSIRASREFEQSVESIKSRMDELRTSTASIKAAADGFRNLENQAKLAQREIDKLYEKQQELIDMGAGGPSDAWNQNQAEIAKVTAELEKQQQAYYDYAAAVEYAEKRLSTGKDEWGHQLSDEEKKTYDEEANYNVELANQAVERIEAAEAALESLKQTQAELAANGENGPTQEFQELQSEIDQAIIRLTDMQNMLNEMRGKGYENADQSDTYQNQVQQLQDLENELDNARAKKEEALKPPYMQSWEQMITVSGMISEGFGRIQNAASGALYAIQHPVQAVDRALGTLIVKATQAAATFARMAGNAALSFLRKLASEAQNAAIQLAKLASNAVHGAFQKLAQGASAAGRGLLGLVKNNKAADGSFKRGFTTILKYAFGVRSMYFLFRRLRTAVKEAFTEMAKSSPEVNAAIRGLQTALNGLKGSLASAFAPIFTAVAPALIYLINMLTAAMNALGAFFAALTGQNSYKKAVGMAKSAGGAASKSAKKAKKDVKDLKRELMGFDELNIIHDDKDNDSSGGGGGGGAGSGMKFVDQQIPGGIKDFVDKLKELWNNKEYVKIGKLIADWINKAIAEAKDLITWENVSAKIQEFVDAIAGIIEGLLIYVDWKNIGDTIAEAFRTVTNTIDTFMQKVGVFMLAGSALAAMVNGFFGNKKLWTDIGKTITDSVHSFLSFGQAFLDGFDAEEAGRGIRSAILTVGDKLPEIAAEFWELVKTAFNKAGSFVNALLGDGEEQPDLSKYVRPKPITANPKITVNNSIWDDLAETLSTGFNTAVEKVTAFISGLPTGSAVTALAGWLVKVKNGINWEAVGTLMGTAFRNSLNSIGAWIDSWAADAETLGGQIASAINGFISEAFKGDTISKHFSTLVKGAFSFLTAFLSKLDEENIATELREAITGIDWDGIAKAAWEAFKTAVGKLGNFLTILFGGDVEPDISKYVRKRPAGMEKQESSQVTSLAQAIGKAVSAALTKLDEWINKIPWDEWGAKIHDFLANLPWGEWGSQLAQALLDLFGNLKEFFGNLVFGKEGYEDYKAYSAGDHRGQHKKVESGNVSQEWYDQYVQLAKQVENYLMNGSWTFNVGSALSLTGWEEFTQETQYAYFMALQNAFTGKEIYDYLTSKGKEATSALAEGIQRGDIDVSEDGEDVVLTFADGTKTQLSKSSEELQKLFEQLGVDSVAGLTTAFGNEQESANTAITDTMDGVVEAANEAVETGSPSKVFEELGNNIVAGLILGLQDLPSKLQTIWESLPEWAQTMFTSLGKTLGIDINANANGNGGNSGDGASSKDTKKVTKVTKKGTKETQKNTKELKKNTAKRGEVDVNYEGAGFDTSGDKPKLNVGVNFVPGDGSEASEENTNGGLLGWLQELLNADTLEAKVALIRDNWESVVNWMYDNGYIGDTLMQLINLAKEGNWDSVIDWFEKEKLIGPALAQLIKLAKEGKWKDVIDWFDKEGFFGPALSQVVELAKQGKWKDVLDWFSQNGYLSENIDQLVQLVKDGDWTGVIDWLIKNNLFGPKLQQLVDLIKDGDWTGVVDWLEKNKLFGPAIQQLVGLIKDGNWTGVIDWLKDKGLFGETLAQLVGLAKDGNWTGIIDWLKQKGLAGPAFEQLVTLVKDNWETFLGFLGLDTSNPLIQTIVDLLFGKEDKGAKDALEAENKDVDVSVDLEKGNEDTQAKETLALGGKSTIAEVIANLIKGKPGTVGEVYSETDKKVTGTTSLTKGTSGTQTVGGVYTAVERAVSGITSLFKGSSGTQTVSGAYSATDKAVTGTTSLTKGKTGAQTVSGAYSATDKAVTGTTSLTKGSSGTQTVSGAYTADDKKVAGKTALMKGDKNTGAQTVSGLYTDADKKVTGKTALVKGDKNTGAQTVSGLYTDKAKKVTGKTALVKGNKNTGAQTVSGLYTDKAKKVTGKTSLTKGSKEDGTQKVSDVYSDSAKKVTGKTSLKKGDSGNQSAADVYGSQSISVSASLSSKSAAALKSAATKAMKGIEVTVKAKSDSGKVKMETQKRGGVIANGIFHRFASGGVISGGVARYLANVPHYAGGTTRAHGTVFVAGEAGPEIMGHINGRTEILNKSQIAEAIYSAVMHGMGAAVNALGKYIANHMTNCTNSIVQTIAANTGPVAGVDYYAPAMATGGIMPYDVAMQIARSTQELQNTLDANNEDLIQAMVSAVGNAAQSIVQAMMTQAARGNQNRPMNTRMVVDDINRAGQMFGQSPIKGV